MSTAVNSLVLKGKRFPLALNHGGLLLELTAVLCLLPLLLFLYSVSLHTLTHFLSLSCVSTLFYPIISSNICQALTLGCCLLACLPVACHSRHAGSHTLSLSLYIFLIWFIFFIVFIVFLSCKGEVAKLTLLWAWQEEHLGLWRVKTHSVTKRLDWKSKARDSLTCE